MLVVGVAMIVAMQLSVSGLVKKTAIPLASAITTSSPKKIVAPSPPVVSTPGSPVRLEIPKIGVDTTILDMGLTKTGAMQVPGNVVNVGWYEYGPDPGDTGSAVIAGHLDGLQGQAGVFANLSKLQLGDELAVIDSKGQTISFVVRAIRIYDQTAPSSDIFNSTSGAHLNLITCTGPWDKTQHVYEQRLVVFTDKV